MTDTNTTNIHVINASAGTGKTTRLLQDVLLDLLDGSRSGAEPRSIRSSLVITFTEAAAAEMRRKLEANLRFAIDYATANADHTGTGLAMSDDHYMIGGDDGDLARAILSDCGRARAVFARALADLPSTQISTIDALAKRIVDRNSELLDDVDPGQQILSDEAMRHDLQQHAMDTLSERWYDPDDPDHDDFLDLLEQFGGPQGDAGLRREMFRLYDSALTKPNGLEWLHGLSAAYDVEFRADKPVYGRNPVIDRCIDGYVARFEDRYPTLLNTIEDTIRLYGPQYPGDLAADDAYLRILPGLAGLPERLRTDTWTDLHALFHDDGLRRVITTNLTRQSSALAKRFGGTTRTPNPDVIRLTDAVRQVQRPLNLMLSLFTFDLDDTNRLNATIRRRLDTLTRLIGRLDAAYRREKRRLHLADFSDIAEWALTVLSDPDHPAAIRRVRDQWRYIYVDESQDDNDLQNAFITLIGAEAEKLTMVGDVKQSIYGFRDASPDTFRRICADVPETRTSQLWVNYRSRPEIISFVNTVFDALMTRDTGRVDYRAERLRMSKTTDGTDDGAIELLLRMRTPTGDGRTEPDEDGRIVGRSRSTADQMHTDLIVRRIRRLHDEEHHRYGDIAVLARSASGFGDLAERLLAEGIPVDVKGVGDFYKKPETVIAVNWLRVIANAHRDVPMLTVLRTLGFTDDDLARLRAACRGSLYTRLRHAARPDERETDGADEWIGPGLHDKCTAFLSLLDDLRRFAQSHPLDEILWHLYTATDLYDYVGRLPDGAQRQTNLESLCVRARTYESTQTHGIRPFLDAVEAWAKDDKAGEETASAPVEDAVHIMTIHKAKGLQWPVVILTAASKDRLPRTMLPSIPVSPSGDGTHGIAGMKLVSTKHELRLDTCQYETLVDDYRSTTVEEELRLLYVALTRPERRLIIAADVAPDLDGSFDIIKIIAGMRVTDTETCMGTRRVLAPRSMIEQADYLSWILRGLLAWRQTPDDTDTFPGVEDWMHIQPNERPRVIDVPLNPDDTDPRAMMPALRITVDYQAAEPEPPTVMDDDTPGYAYANKRMSILAERPAVDGDLLTRIPAVVNASGAGYWMAGPQAMATGPDETIDDMAADLATGDDGTAWRRRDFDLPGFMTAGPGRRPSPAETGTGAHNVLELFDWTTPADDHACRARLLEDIDRLERHGVIRPPIADVLRGPDTLGDLLWFVTGGEQDETDAPLRELTGIIRANPGRLFREEPFTMLIDSGRLMDPTGHGTLPAGEDVVVRGIIDGFIVDDTTRRITLFDYKTDRIRDDETTDEWATRLAADYRLQQDLYARALEQRFAGYHVIRRWLIGLSGRRLIDVR